MAALWHAEALKDRFTLPRGESSLLRRSALGLLRLFGWRSSFVWPPEPKGLIVVYPHTSNWDFPIGGIPLDRTRATGFVDALVEEFRSRDWMWVAITPEGTRSHTEYLKSGFHQVALAAGVPVALAYIDFGTKTVGMDTYVRFTGDRERDMDLLRAFYADKRGQRPELAGDIRLKD